MIHAAERGLGLLVLFVVGVLHSGSAYQSLTRWDAHWYRRVAEHGYGFSHVVPDGRTLSDFAFFPLYPALERLVSTVTALPIMGAGLVISAVSSVAAAAGIFLVGAHVLDTRSGIVLVLLWSTLPVSIVQSMAYTESLFTALVAWSLYATLRQRFVVAGVLASLAGLTRPTGAALAAAVVVAAVLSFRSGWSNDSPSATGRWGQVARPAVGALVAPLGTIGFLGYVGVREHDVFGYFHVANGWGNNVDGGASFLSWTGRMVWGPTFLVGLILSAGLVLLGVLMFRMVRNGYPPAVLVFAFLSVLLVLSTSGYFGSKPRYLVPVFPLLMPLAAVLARLPRGRLLAVSMGLTVVSGVYGSIWLFGPGPP